MRGNVMGLTAKHALYLVTRERFRTRVGRIA